MATDLKTLLDLEVPQNQTRASLKEIDEAIKKLSPEYGNVFSSQGYKGKIYSFKDYAALKNFLIKDLGFPTDTPNKYFEFVVLNWYESATEKPEYESTTTEAPQYKKQTQTTVSEKTNEAIFEEAEKRQEADKKTRSDSKKAVEEAILKKQELRDQQILKQQIQQAENAKVELKDKVLYAAVEIPELPPLDKNEQEDFETLQKFATGTNKEKLEIINDFKTGLEEKLKSDPNNQLSEDDIKFIADTSARDIVEKLASASSIKQTEEMPVFVQAPVLKAISEDEGVVPKLLPQETADVVKTNSVTLQEKYLPYFANKQNAILILGPKYADYLYGPENIQVRLSTNQIPGSTPVKLDKLNQDSIELRQRQNETIDFLRQAYEPRQVLMDSARSFFEKRLEGVSKDIAVSVSKNPAIQSILTRYSPQGAQLLQTASKYLPGYSPYFRAIGTITGWGVATAVTPRIIPLTFGMGGLTPGSIVSIEAAKWAGTPFVYSIPATKAVTQLATQTGLKGIIGQVAARFGIGAAVGAAGGGSSGAAAGAAAGAVAGGGVLSAATAALGAILGTLFTNLLSKLKTWWTKNKDNLAAVGVGLLGLGILTRSVPLMVGSSLFLLPRLLAGGGIAAGLGASAWLFISNLGRFFAVAIGTPLLIIILVTPPLVAFIMFVINSGAYIVPPFEGNLSLGGFSSPYVDITKEPVPAGPFSNSEFPKTVQYKITVKPKKGNLNNVKLTYDCKVISRSSSIECPSITVLDELYKDIFNQTLDSISPTGISFTYSSSYDNRFKDSAIIDSISLSATTTDNKSVSAETSASITYGTPPISCPVPGAKPLNSMNYSYNASNDTGHGSRPYWNAMGGSAYRYALPQSTGCRRPSDCSYYGYAYDVFPTGTKEVFAPTVEGKDVTWQCSYAFVNPGAGNTYKCISTNGGYTLVLTHMNSGAKTGTIKSGEKIGSLFNQTGNTHLHIEFQVNGRWVKPEQYFCR